ncbi:MAG: sensor histidine kinase [Sedimentibacter sp.]|jgi:signal transduction histidine kinase|nr:sensor histidine kinase [Tissierellia bacterium]MDD3750685.1 sensor histidine kinase [Tissierellia bacterium]MDD4046148.1 sensor histidine kinase [Tissierellia bacterium]
MNKSKSLHVGSLINSYLKEQKLDIIMYFVSVFIFALIFKLNHISVKIALYPAIICMVLWIIYAAFNFYRYCKYHWYRVDISSHIEITLKNLPKPESLIEEDYQNLLNVLMTYNRLRLSENNQKYTDMSEYITLWAHQMKTPITAASLLLNELSNDEKYKIKEQLFEIERYVDTTLQFMRLDTMNSDLLLKEYSLIQIVKQGVKYYSKVFISKGISLNLDEFDTTVVTDEKWFLFVIKQILSNSLKYTDEGSISIYVVPDKTLVIEDTGIGISGEDIPRIFERGFTGYTGRMDKKATGIGLYLSKQILDKLNHNIKIYSQPGVGTKAEIDLTSSLPRKCTATISNLTKL